MVSSSCKDRREQTGSRGGGAMSISMSCEVIAKRCRGNEEKELCIVSILLTSER